MKAHYKNTRLLRDVNPRVMYLSQLLVKQGDSDVSIRYTQGHFRSTLEGTILSAHSLHLPKQPTAEWLRPPHPLRTQTCKVVAPRPFGKDRHSSKNRVVRARMGTFL